MASPTSPIRVTQYNKSLIYGLESAAAGTLATALTKEPCRSVSLDVIQGTEQQTEYTGTAFAHTGEASVARHSAVNFEVALRDSGAGAIGLLTMCGNGSETVAAGPPVLHTGVPSVTTTSCNTWSLLVDQGDRTAGNVPQNIEQVLFGSLSSIALRIQPNGIIPATLSFLGKLPTNVALPTIATYIGSTTNYSANYLYPYQTVFNVYSSAGTLYTSKITSGTFNLTRNVSPEFGLGSVDPFDFVPGELMISGGFTATFDGAGSASMRRDFINYVELGDVTHVHNIAITQDSAHAITLNFYPIKITAAAVDNSTRVKVNCTFTNYNAAASLNAAAPAATTLKSVVIASPVVAAFTT